MTFPRYMKHFSGTIVKFDDYRKGTCIHAEYPEAGHDVGDYRDDWTYMSPESTVWQPLDDSEIAIYLINDLKE